MAITNICGFETGTAGSDSEGTLNGTGATIQTTTKRSGSYALKINPVTTDTAYFEMRNRYLTSGAEGTSGNTTAYYRFYVLFSALPSSTEPIFSSYSSTPSLKLELRLTSGGLLIAVDATTATQGTGTTALTTGVWYRIGVMVGTGSPASWEVLINGVSEMSGSAANLQPTANVNARCGKHLNRSGSGYEAYFDDFAISDSAYPGAGVVACLRPSGNGNYTAWTGTSTDVDDLTSQAGHDTDTTYINTSTLNNAETVALENCSDRGISGTINAVKSIVIVRSVSGTTNNQMRTRVTSPGTLDTDTTSFDPLTTYRTLAQVFATNPSGGAAWDSAGVDSLEVGCEHNQSQARELRCTMICAMVDFTATELLARPLIITQAVRRASYR